MIASIEDLVVVGQADPDLAGVLAACDWYLVGSRAAGTGDELSDWDTVALSPVDPAEENLPTTRLDTAFQVSRPVLTGRPTLAFHQRWRRTAAVEMTVLGPTGRARREQRMPVEWAYDLRHAVLLQATCAVGETYRAQVADRFARACPELAQRTYRQFRQARNEAVAALARPDRTAQAITTAACVRDTARFWLLALGRPYPAEKWLPQVVERLDGTAILVSAWRVAIDAGHDPSERFDCLWDLWQLVDVHAQNHGIDDSLLAGSPFRR